MSRQSHWLGSLVLAAAFAASAEGALYKWTDAQGRVVYSDQPPAGSTKVEEVRPAPPPANPNAAKELAQREADYKKRQTDAVAAAAKADKDRNDDAKLAESCAQARGQLKQLDQSQVALYRYNAKGEREQLDDAAREKERAKINAFIKDSKCPA